MSLTTTEARREKHIFTKNSAHRLQSCNAFFAQNQGNSIVYVDDWKILPNGSFGHEDNATVNIYRWDINIRFEGATLPDGVQRIDKVLIIEKHYRTK